MPSVASAMASKPSPSFKALVLIISLYIHSSLSFIQLRSSSRIQSREFYMQKSNEPSKASPIDAVPILVPDITIPNESLMRSDDDISTEDYDSFFDFNRPIPDQEMRDEWSLRSEGKYKAPTTKSETNERKSNRRLWPFWDDFMESELGDIEAELAPGDEWLSEARDYIELKRGRAIWSKRSDQEIQAEMKKQLAAKGMIYPSLFLAK